MADEVVRDAVVVNEEGIHARPVMQLVSAASRFQSEVEFSNVSRRAEALDGKSPLDMMLLEATCGSVIRIRATGADAREAVDTLAALIESGFSATGTDENAGE